VTPSRLPASECGRCERQRRGLRRLTIDVSEDDLRAIAKRSYEGAVTTDHDRRLKLSAFSSTTLFCKSDRLDQTGSAVHQRHDCLPRPPAVITGGLAQKRKFGL
jgi:hypothetical protein